MPNQTLSVREADVPLWERARRRAEQTNTTLSSLVATALAKHLSTTSTISVMVDDPKYHEERFEGRWLVEPHDPDLFSGKSKDNPEAWAVGIAETARGRIALYLAFWSYEGANELRVYDSIKELREAVAGDPRVPRHLVDDAASALRPEGRDIVWRDI